MPGMTPGDRLGDDLDRGDAAGAVRRWDIASFRLQAWQPSRIGQPLGDPQPIGREKVVESAEVTDDALPNAAGGGTNRFYEKVVGIGTAIAGLTQATKEHVSQGSVG